MFCLSWQRARRHYLLCKQRRAATCIICWQDRRLLSHRAFRRNPVPQHFAELRGNDGNKPGRDEDRGESSPRSGAVAARAWVQSSPPWAAVCGDEAGLGWRSAQHLAQQGLCMRKVVMPKGQDKAGEERRGARAPSLRSRSCCGRLLFAEPSSSAFAVCPAHLCFSTAPSPNPARLDISRCQVNICTNVHQRVFVPLPPSRWQVWVWRALPVFANMSL